MHPLNQHLHNTFLFAFDEVRANRAGKLTPRQIARLQESTRNPNLALAVFLVVTQGARRAYRAGILEL